MQPSNWRGLFSVAVTWSLIALAMALVAAFPNPATVLVALGLIGGRQLALAILMHDASHRSLCRSRALNDYVGTWLCGAPIWQNLGKYRRHHLVHHSHTGTEKDNDLVLVQPFPTSRRSMVRKFARDLLGVSGVRRVVAQLMMDLGLLTYTASLGAERIDVRGRSWREFVAMAASGLGPFLVTNAVLWGCLFAIGHGWLYALWVVSYLTTFSLFLRIRSIAEHACTEESADQLRNTRTTRAGVLARLTVAPHFVNYHLEHHALMTVPHYRLPTLHRLLRERDV
ncbi:MAG: fatty acid desaturase family protein, partial [Acidobacteriota bacterium]